MTTQLASSPDTVFEDRPPIPRGRAAWLATAVLLVGPLLQTAQFVVGGPGEGAATAWWAEHPDRAGLSQAFGVLAIPWVIAGFWVMGRITVRHSSRTTYAALALLVTAMVGLAVVQGLEIGANWLVQSGDPEAATVLMDVSDLEILGPQGIAAFAMFMGGAVLGLTLLTVALARSPYVPRVVPVLVVAFFALDFFLGLGVVAHLVTLTSHAILGWALLTGYRRAGRGTSPRR